VGRRAEINPYIVVCNKLTDIVELYVDMLASCMVLRAFYEPNGSSVVTGNRDSKLAL
jgi:hypothetical protein